MTLVAEPRADVQEDVRTPPTDRRWEAAEHVAVAAGLIWWAVPFVHASGGQQPHALLVMALVALPGLVLSRPWRRLPTWVLALGGLVPVAAFAVCLTSPTGWTGADVAAGYGVAAVLSLTVLAWVSGDGELLPRSRRGPAVALLLLLGGLEQLTQALVPWWGGGDPSVLLTGTYAWYNPFAAALMVPALVGLGLVVEGARPARKVGWLVAPGCVAGVVLSSSRATLLALVVGWALISLALLVPSGDRLGRVRRIVVVSALAGALTYVLPGPPLFPHRASPFTATTSRSSGGESVSADAGYRTEFWREAVQVFEHHPVSGGGFRSLSLASQPYVPSTWALSPQAHNGFLQPFSDGGLVLGLPFTAAMGAIGLAALRRAKRSLRDPQGGLAVVSAAGLLAVFAHSAVDFDWSRPALMVMPAALLAVGGGLVRSQVRRPSRGAVGLLVVAAVVPAVAAHARTSADRTLVAAQLQHGEAKVRALDAASGRATAGDRAAQSLLQLALSDSGGQVLAIPRAVALDAVARTSGSARIDSALAIRRARVQLAAGQADAARATYARLLPVALRRPSIAAALAPLAQDLGRQADLLPTVTASFFLDVTPPLDLNLWAEEVALSHLAPPELSGCAAQLASGILPRPSGVLTLDAPPAGTDCAAVIAAARP